jgi:hypothetical protein
MRILAVWLLLMDLFTTNRCNHLSCDHTCDMCADAPQDSWVQIAQLSIRSVTRALSATMVASALPVKRLARRSVPVLVSSPAIHCHIHATPVSKFRIVAVLRQTPFCQ